MKTSVAKASGIYYGIGYKEDYSNKAKAVNRAEIVGPVSNTISTVDPKKIWIIQAYKRCLGKLPSDDWWYENTETVSNAVYGICGSSEAYSKWTAGTQEDGITRLYEGILGRTIQVDTDVTDWIEWYNERSDKGTQTGYQALVKQFVNSSEFHSLVESYGLSWKDV